MPVVDLLAAVLPGRYSDPRRRQHADGTEVRLGPPTPSWGGASWGA
jgi:hypothetical protein